jgi:8-hydroxy-5-deazaflavin:NADPH oxidoreductase
MTVLGLIGSGHIGSTVARLAVEGGVDVVVSNSRGPETLADLVAQLGPRARAATAEEAARAGDIVVVTIPFHAYRQVPRAALAGKTVLDTNNYYPERDGAFPQLDGGETTSSELLQQYLDESHVVKVFNNIFFEHLAALPRPSGAADRSALAIAGDDAAAKREATALLDTLGYDAVDLGALSEGWRFQPGTPAYGPPYAQGPDFINSPARPASAAALAAVLTAATR